MVIAKYGIKRILVDNGSSTDILFYKAFSQMNLFEDRLRRVSTSLTRFIRNSVGVESKIMLHIIARSPP